MNVLVQNCRSSLDKPALFLDRDGVINYDHGYVCRIEDFKFLDGIFELVSFFKAKGYLVIIITNQAGIGRGYYTVDQFGSLMEWVLAQFDAKNAGIDGYYFCPFHPEAALDDYKRDSFDRKPNPGMLLKAVNDFGLSLHSSVFIGDNFSDMVAGARASVGNCFLYDPSYKIPDCYHAVGFNVIRRLDEIPLFIA